jgi:hypothetical protein
MYPFPKPISGSAYWIPAGGRQDFGKINGMQGKAGIYSANE